MNIDFTIDEFNGPLDLLLHLVKESKMDILNIEIEEITNQYLAYLDKMEEMNLEVTSEYLVMASELMYIKSKMLLPKREEEETDEEEIDPREELVNRLLEYEAYKEITKTLKEKEEIRSEIYTKAPGDIKEYMDQEVKLSSELSVDDLVDAFKKFLQRKSEEKPIHTKVTEKEITVSERRARIKNILHTKKRVSFFELFEDYSKEYVVATFLAILEMAKEKELIISQEKAFDDIICEVGHE
jgi:segregation and condensation protein A